MEKKPILNLGNKNDGFSIVEASISLFIAGVLLLAILGFVRLSVGFSGKEINKIEYYIQSQNEYAENHL